MSSSQEGTSPQSNAPSKPPAGPTFDEALALIARYYRDEQYRRTYVGTVLHDREELVAILSRERDAALDALADILCHVRPTTEDKAVVVDKLARARALLSLRGGGTKAEIAANTADTRKGGSNG